MEVLNPSPKTDWVIGDACFVYDPSEKRIIKACIHDIGPDCAYMRFEDGEDVCVMFKRLFPSHAEAMDAMLKANDARYKAYRVEIASVDDLVRFAYQHYVANGDATDWEARAAFRERAMELLGIVLPA